MSVASTDHRGRCCGTPDQVSIDPVRGVCRLKRAITVVQVIGNGLDVVVRIWIEVLAGLSGIAAALRQMKQMRNHARTDEPIAVLVEVDSPGIAGPVRVDFELVSHRMVPPHAGVQRSPVFFGRPRFANVGMGEHAMATIQPPVHAPSETVEGFVSVLVSPAIQ